MQLKQLTALALAGVVSGQSLTDVIGQNQDLSQLGTLLGQYPDLAQTLGGLSNITVLAPNNAALSALLNDSSVTAAVAADPGLVPAILTYHVLNGTIRSTDITDTPAFPKTLLTNSTYTNVTGGQVVKAETEDNSVVFTSGLLRQSRVATADVTFTGGIVHIIDSVLTIPANDSATALAANLTALAGALTTADLVSTVDMAQDVTIFAPSNEAFAAIQNLAANLSTEQLSSILTYHVVQGTVGYSSSLTSGLQLTTLNNGQVTITIDDGDVFVNSAEVEVADVLVSNGVVHVIDNVLNPDNSTARPDVTASTQLPAFSGASSASGVPFTSGITATGTAAPTGGAGATATSSTAAQAGVPMQTAAVGAAALFGGAAMLANW
ncbi:beta-ig-h3 fasciclin [Diaporthe eres]|uniref:FAS1 domain-containing protein n=1 Tax=Diaporthe vaccinii TaxID=105482 RepID=A0ABR4EBJ9_9PEZI|nr:beta-ig-h3 fasciclin [Diaporthe eres]